MTDLEEARSLLREWAYFFRDRARKGRAFSAEGNWRSPQVWDPPKPRPAYEPRRAARTWEILKTLPKPDYRAITWRYCYPFLPVAIPLRSLSRRLGRRVNLKGYEEMVLVGEYRFAAALYNEPALLYKPTPISGPGRAFTL